MVTSLSLRFEDKGSRGLSDQRRAVSASPRNPASVTATEWKEVARWLRGKDSSRPMVYSSALRAKHQLKRDLSKFLKMYSYLLYFDHNDMKQEKKNNFYVVHIYEFLHKGFCGYFKNVLKCCLKPHKAI